MFVAWKDLRFAKGRFALMGGVVALLTLLVVLLSGLTAGLARDSGSAIAGLPADHVVFSAPAPGQSPSFAESRISPDAARGWQAVPGVESAAPFGIATAKASAADRHAVVSAFGVPPASELAPDGGRLAPGQVVLSAGAAEELGARPGERITVAGTQVTVAAVAGEAAYSHTPVVWTTLSDWRRLAPPGSGDATAIALRTSGGADLAAADRRLSTTTVSRSDALSAIGSYSAENGSLKLIRGLLFAISALVVGAFFTVWTLQRSRDVAVLTALGATTRYVVLDALGQALVLLVASAAVGAGVAAAVGAVAAQVVPFALDAGSLLLPTAAMAVLGALGAALAIRRVTAVDPLIALGAAQ